MRKWAKPPRHLGGPRYICRARAADDDEAALGAHHQFLGIDPVLGGSVTKGMAKLGIVGFTRGIAREFREHEITANCIAPGTIESERDPHLKAKGLRPAQPIRRLGRAQESRVADCCTSRARMPAS